MLGQDSRIADRFAPPVAFRLEGTIDSARHEGLPTKPLILRALEGHAKGASPDQIVGAVARLREALRESRHALGNSVSEGEMTTAAAALQAGVPEARLTELHQLRGKMSIAAPLSAYLDLTARGALPDRAWSRISDLARRRASDAEFVRLTPADVDRDPAIRPHKPAPEA